MPNIEPKASFNLVGDLTPEKLQQFRQGLRPTGFLQHDRGIQLERNPLQHLNSVAAEGAILPIAPERVRQLAPVQDKPPLLPRPRPTIAPLQDKPPLLPRPTGSKQPAEAVKGARPLPPIPVRNQNPLAPVGMHQEPTSGQVSLDAPANVAQEVREDESVQNNAEIASSSPTKPKENAFKRLCKRIWNAVKNFFISVGEFFKYVFCSMGELTKVKLGGHVIYDTSEANLPDEPAEESIDGDPFETADLDLDPELDDKPEDSRADPAHEPLHTAGIPPAPPLPDALFRRNVVVRRSVGEADVQENQPVKTSSFKQKVDERVADVSNGFFALVADGLNLIRQAFNGDEDSSDDDDASGVELTFNNQQQVQTIVQLNPFNGRLNVERTQPPRPEPVQPMPDFNNIFEGAINARPLAFSDSDSDPEASSLLNDDDW